MTNRIFTDYNLEVSVTLNSGGVGVLPTDTLYGLVCRAEDEKATRRLYDLKKRENKPGTIIASNTDQLLHLGLDERMLLKAKKYWPNPLSILIPIVDREYLHQGKSSLACRIVAGPEQLIKLLDATGPLLTSSANHPGEIPASTIEQAKMYFGDKVDFYIDGGDMSKRQPSTVAKLSSGELEILRQGAYG